MDVGCSLYQFWLFGMSSLEEVSVLISLLLIFPSILITWVLVAHLTVWKEHLIDRVTAQAKTITKQTQSQAQAHVILVQVLILPRPLLRVILWKGSLGTENMLLDLIIHLFLKLGDAHLGVFQRAANQHVWRHRQASYPNLNFVFLIEFWNSITTVNLFQLKSSLNDKLITFSMLKICELAYSFVELKWFLM